MQLIYPPNFLNNVNQNVEHEVIFEDADGTRWRRTGYCSNCGDCCDDDDDGFLLTDANGNSPGIPTTVHGKCAYFRWDENGKSTCTARDTYYYNNACVFMPSRKLHVDSWPNCTFKFEKII